MPTKLDEWIENSLQVREKLPLSDQHGSIAPISVDDLKQLADPLVNVSPLYKDALRNFAIPRTFDQALAEHCLLQDIPGNLSFNDLVQMPYVELLSDINGLFRIENNTRQALLSSWWPKDTNPATVPQNLREVSRCLVGAYAERGDQLEQLYHLIAVNRNQARGLFRRLFDDADSRVDLPRCHALLRILEERQELLGTSLSVLQNQKQLRLETRSMWAQEYYETVVYFERDVTRNLMSDLIKGKDHWILHLYALGGIGKTMFIRASIANFCVPRGIPCARIDFDFVPHIVEAAREPWRLLLRIINQLNLQLLNRPFEELLADYARYMVEAGERRMARPRPVIPVEPYEQDRIRQDIMDRFLTTMGNVWQERPYLVVFDTLEELRFRQIELGVFFDLLQELHQESPGLRVILAGRYNLEEVLHSGQDLPIQLTDFVERFGGEESTVQLFPFNNNEAQTYLEQKRGMVGDVRLPVIIAKCDGNPFKLALLADIARDNPDLTAQEIDEYAAVDLVYLINRVVDRIRDDLVKWLLRYGVVPRLLTLDFLAKVMIPFIEKGIAGDTTHDNPSADRLPAQALVRNLFPVVQGVGPLNAQAIWQSLMQYASQASWVYTARGMPNALSFHPEVVEPMRYLLKEQRQEQRDIYLALNREAAAYFEKRAQEDPDNRARWMRESVYHRFQLDEPIAAAEFWRGQLNAATDDPQTAIALAEEVLWLPRRTGQRTADNRIQTSSASDDIRAIAAYELARRRLESELPLNKVDWMQLKDWLAIVEEPAGRQAIHESKLAYLKGRIQLADLQIEDALLSCLQALQHPVDHRIEMELHLLAADALLARRRTSDGPEIESHYLQAIELAQEFAPRRIARIAPILAQNLLAEERYLETVNVYRLLYDVALAADDLNRVGEWTLAQLEIQVTIGREAEAVRLGEEGLLALQSSSSLRQQEASGKQLKPGWINVLKAAINLTQLQLAPALSELNQALRPGTKGLGDGLFLDVPEEWRELGNKLRAQIEVARLNVADAVACLEKLAWDIYRPNTSDGMRSLLACAYLFIDGVGDSFRAERYLASMRENERHHEPRAGWRARRQLLEIRCLCLEGKNIEARQQADQLAQDIDPTWPPGLRAQIAIERVIQTGGSADAMEGLIGALEKVQPASLRLILLEDLQRCPQPEAVLTEVGERLLALLPTYTAEGQDKMRTALRIAEVHRVIGHVDEARTLLNQAEKAGQTPLRLALLRRVFLAHDRIGWFERDLVNLALPADDDFVWNEGRELSGLVILEHAERLVRSLKEFEGAADLLKRAASLLGDPQSFWTPRLAAIKSAIAFAREDSMMGETEWQRAVTAFRTQGNRQGILPALELALSAVKFAFGSEPKVAEIYNNLGNILREQNELDAAIQTIRQAVGFAAVDSPKLPVYLNNLGTSLNARYAHTGRPEDLDEAIKAYHRAVDLTSPDSQYLPNYLSNLSNGLHARYARTGQSTDLEQVISVSQRAIKLTPPDSPTLPSLLNNLGNGFSARYARSGQLADLEQAIIVSQQAVQRTPPDSSDLPGYLNNLGNGLRARFAHTGQLADLEQAINVSGQAVQLTPPGSPTLPSLLDNLGNGLSARYIRTRQLSDLEQAIGVTRQAVQLTPQGSPELHSRLNNLGILLQTKGNYAEARPYYEQALAIRRKVLGDQHPDIAASLNNLGALLEAMGNYTEARPYYEQALAIRRETLGDQHLDTAASLSNLGALLEAMGNYTEARPYYEQALAIRRKVLGDQQPDTAASLNNLGALLQSMGNFAEARPYYEQALAIRRKVLGDQHPDTAASLNNLGTLCQALGDFNGALIYYEQAQVIVSEIGDRRGEGAILGNLGIVYNALGQPKRAIEFYEQALVIAREIGDRRGEGNHLGNLGNAYIDIGEDQRSINCYEQALVIVREIGDRRGEGNHLTNLGIAYNALGQPIKAIEFYEQALVIAREIGDRRGEGAILGNLGIVYNALGQPKRAIEFYEQALVIAREIGDWAEENNLLKSLDNFHTDLDGTRDKEQFIGGPQVTVNVSQDIGAVSGSVVGILIGKIYSKQESESTTAKFDLISTLKVNQRIVSIKPDTPSSWQVVLSQHYPDGDRTVLSRRVELSRELQHLLSIKTDESFNPTFVKEFSYKWVELSARLGKKLFPENTPAAEFLGSDKTFILFWELKDPRLSWLPWELIRANPQEPPISLASARPYVFRRLDRLISTDKPERDETRNVDVLIVRAGQAIEKQMLRGDIQEEGPDLLHKYLSRGARAEELSQPELWALADMLDRLNPRVIHIQAGIRDRGRRLLLDFGAEGGYTKTEASFSARDLANVLIKPKNPPIVVLDSPSPPGIFERLRLLCLRNAYASELALASGIPLAILGTGLADFRQRPKLSEVLVTGIARRDSFGEIARSIHAIAGQGYSANVWADMRGQPSLDAVLPFLGTSLFIDDSLLISTSAKE